MRKKESGYRGRKIKRKGSAWKEEGRGQEGKEGKTLWNSLYSWLYLTSQHTWLHPRVTRSRGLS